MDDGQFQLVHEAGFAGEVLASAKPVMVEFFATWCGSCRRLTPILDKLSIEQPRRAKFVKINADDSPQLVRTYGVSSTPTLMLFVTGEPIASLIGAQSKTTIRNWLHDAIDTHPGIAGANPEQSWVDADACTLPTMEQPLRVAEFGRLFSEAVRAVQRVTPTQLRLELVATAKATAQDLVARETDCCSFF